MSILAAFALLLLGFVLLVGGAELLVHHASKLGVYYGLSPVVVGATIVAFGTSAPELAVSLLAALGGEANLSIANGVGSNVANIGLVLGLAAMVSPIPTSLRVIRVEYTMALGASVLLACLAWDGALDLVDGLLLLAVFGVTLSLYVIKAVLRGGQALGTAEFAAEEPKKDVRPVRSWLLLLIGLGTLLGGSRLVVLAAVTLAQGMGMSTATIGASIVALGTSLPEVSASLVAAIRKHHGLAIGNVFGSNFFNMLFVLGIPACYPGLRQSGALNRQVMVAMLGITLMVLPIMLTRRRVGRLGGLFLFVLYLAFAALLAGSQLGWFPFLNQS